MTFGGCWIRSECIRNTEDWSERVSFSCETEANGTDIAFLPGCGGGRQVFENVNSKAQNPKVKCQFWEGLTAENEQSLLKVHLELQAVDEDEARQDQSNANLSNEGS